MIRTKLSGLHNSTDRPVLREDLLSRIYYNHCRYDLRK